MEDLIIPNQGVQRLDRYAGMMNNPVFYTDPDGYDICDEVGNCYRKGEKYQIRTGSVPVFLNPVEPMERGAGYDYGDDHPSGIDLNPDNSKNPNLDVVASSYGVVYSSTACTIDPCVGTTYNANMGYGNVVIIGYEYDNLPTIMQKKIPEGATLYILYAHLEEPSTLQEGNEVVPGQLIGNVGNTGHSTGTHLHFEIRIEERDKLPMGDLHIAEGPGAGYTNVHFTWHNLLTPLNPRVFFIIR